MKWINLIKKFLPDKKKKQQVYDFEDLDIDERTDYVKKIEVSSSLKENINNIQKVFGDSFDLNIRKFEIGEKNISAVMVYMSGLADSKAISNILESIQIELLKVDALPNKKEHKHHLYETIIEEILNNESVQEAKKLEKILDNITLGSSAILIEGVSQAIICETKGFAVRSIQEPENEVVLRGPREGFVESIFTNTSLLRRRIRVPHLWFQGYEIGALSKTKVALAYIKGLASEELIDEVKSRLESIDIDAILESGYIQEFITDQPFSLFPLIDRTERPDVVVSCLVEGKVAILVDNTPFVLILPTNFNMYLQAPDDYYEPFPITSLIRVVRYVSFLFSIALPGVYVAVLNYHPELLPISLLLRISATREGVPFPLIIESLLMEFIFEILREAGLRLPKAIGAAVSIVGGLVVGQAAINAGLVSPPMVIIVALTAISSFTSPSYALGLGARVLRFVFLFLGATTGLFGIQFGFLLLLIHLCSLRSFGEPYFQPFGPLIWEDLNDSIIRFPHWLNIFRPKLIGGRNPKRQNKKQKPKSPEKGKGEDDNV